MEDAEIIQEITNFLNKQKMTMTDFGKRLDVPHATVSRWLNRHMPPCPSSCNHIRLFIKTYKPSRIKEKGTK